MPQSVLGLVPRGNQTVAKPAARRTTSGPRSVRHRSARPLLHWKPIAAAAIVTLTFMVTVAFGMRPTATSGEAVAGRGLDLAAATAMRPAAAVVEIPAEAVAIAQVVPIPEPVAPAVAAGPANVPPVDVPRLEPVAFADVKPFVNTDLAPAPIQVAEEKVVAVAIVPDKIDKPREIVKVEIPKHIARPGCKNFGTFVDFVRSPQLASREAKDDSKLVFLLHVSGDFDDDAFT